MKFGDIDVTTVYLNVSDATATRDAHASRLQRSDAQFVFSTFIVEVPGMPKRVVWHWQWKEW